MRKTSSLLVLTAAAAAAFAGTGSVMAGRVVDVRRKPRYSQRIVAVEGDRLTLDRNGGTDRVGTYGLAFRGGHVVVGEVVERTETTVVRSIVRVDSGQVAPGPAVLDHVDVGDPGTAFGLPFREVVLRSDVGELPAWEVPADGDTWVVLVHGYGGRRASALSFLPMLHELGMTALVPAYRNDPDAPTSPDGRCHLGATEWRDVEAAIGHAVTQGASHVVLYGWSMGGAIALQAYAHTAHRPVVAALLLDSPVVDWRAVLRYVGRQRRVPGVLVRYTMALVERRIGMDLDDLDWLRRAGELDVPTLIVHGDDDETVPWEPSRDLAERLGDLAQLRIVAGAGHVGSWNVDPAGYARSVGAFLAAALSTATA